MSEVQRYPCEQCGAQLTFAPGTTVLKCPYCAHETPIAPPDGTVDELDLHAFLDRAVLNTELEHDKVLHCNNCAAEFSVPPNQETQDCPFCGSNVVVPTDPEHRIVPNAVLPFVVTDKEARGHTQKWLSSRFWAPSDLKTLALKEGRLKGMYIPYWTFDCQTETDYTGARGEHYYETETYTDSNGNRQTRQVRRTRWYPAAGHVSVHFDDILVLGSNAIPQKYAQRLVRWDLEALAPYEPRFLVGFQTMRYDIDLATGFGMAQQMMQPRIDQAIRYDIGGDEQAIHSKDTDYLDPSFKLTLLPIWVGGYRYRGRSFRFLVNGQTGEIQGEAPISVWKVLIAILLGSVLLALLIYLFGQKG